MVRSGHQARPAVVCMRGFQETRTFRANSGRARHDEASEHQAVRPPSSLAGLAGRGAGAFNTRTHEVHLNSSCGMLRPIGKSLNNFPRGWQQGMPGNF